ncbi:MAG: helix-turn-helix domain-containing protein [Acidobacteria bacterium]|nr:helix-turn-helix domain-containing protein [Acidobacteriota bacterium]
MKRATITPRLLSASEVAEYLGLPLSSVYDYAKTKRLPSLRVGRDRRSLRFDVRDLDRWIELHKAAERQRPSDAS